MKRIVPALALVLALFGGCTDAQTEFVIAGLDNPICGSASNAAVSTVPEEAYIDTRLQSLVFGQISRDVAVDLLNELASPSQANATGQNATVLARDDITLTGLNVTVTDLSGTNVATETLPIAAYIPAGGAKNVVTFDIMGKPLADALLAQIAFPKNPVGAQKLLATLTFTGKVVSGGDITTNPYTFPLDIAYGNIGGLSEVQKGNDVQTIAVLVDGGLADEVILPDGTAQLGDVLPDGGVGVVDNGMDFVNSFREQLNTVGTDGGVVIPFGVVPCE